MREFVISFRDDVLALNQSPLDYDAVAQFGPCFHETLLHDTVRAHDEKIGAALLDHERLGRYYDGGLADVDISGYISERSADIGTLVGPGGQSLLATVVKSDTVRVDFSMTALDYLRSKARNVNLGHKDSTRKWDPYITVTLADDSQYPFRGLVDFALS